MTVAHVVQLAEVVERLEAAYLTARAELERQFHETGFTPEEIKDPNGRYILLDALVALTQARTALAAMPPAREPRGPRIFPSAPEPR